MYFAFLNIHRSLNVANITPHGPDDGSVELKHCSVDFSINFSFHLDYLVINFSTYCQITILYLLSYIYIYIYIYISGQSKYFKPHLERGAIDECFCGGINLPLLIKLEKLIVLISVQVWPIQKWGVCKKSKTGMSLRTVWTTIVYVRVGSVCSQWCLVVTVSRLGSLFKWSRAVLNTGSTHSLE